MVILIIGLFYAIFMIAVGINEIYFYSTGESAFISSLILTFSAGILLGAFVWKFSAKTKN
ncbi:hypothetical protein IV04_09280 [Serratia sp. Ag1]|nr:hypothetical protein JV45_12185 [Serratia sp. Ag2]KFK99180.1 hypothetical protein IV04_09280 [Serratia sp. Ag1]